MGKTIATGDPGCLGSLLVGHLLRRGYHVTVLDNLLYGQTSLLLFCGKPNSECVRGYVRDERLMRQLLKTHDAILPLAAIPFEQVFARKIKALGLSRNVAIAIITSGNSPNVLPGVQAAREIGITTIGLTGGDGGKPANIVDCAIVVPSNNTAHIQKTHMAVGPALCGATDQALV